MDTPPNLEVILDVPVKITVELGTCQMAMRDVLQLSPGSVVQLDKLADQPVDLYVNQKMIAHGEVVVIEDRLGLRITSVLGVQPAAALPARFEKISPIEQPHPPARSQAPAVAEARGGITTGPVLGTHQA